MVLFDPTQNPGQPLHKRTIPINFGQEGISRVAIHSYQFTGLANIGPVFLNIKNQATTGMYSNKGSSQFPLLIGQIPDFAFNYSNSLTVVEGDNVWNNAHSLEVELLDFFNQPVVFGAAYILFEIFTRDPHWPKEQPPGDEVKRRSFRETTTRNIQQGSKYAMGVGFA